MALTIAIGALAAAVAWRSVRLVRMRRGINAALRDDDPNIRIAAVEHAAEIGLAATAPALLRAVREETDPAVLASVVLAVATRQWEPASTARIVELRLWAKAYAERHPELRRGHLSQAPLLPGVAGTVPPPSLDPARADEFRTRSDSVPVDPGFERPRLLGPCRAAARARRRRARAGAGAGHRRGRPGRRRGHPRPARRVATTSWPSTPIPARSASGWPTSSR